jgi:hypothetical protein
VELRGEKLTFFRYPAFVTRSFVIASPTQSGVAIHLEPFQRSRSGFQRLGFLDPSLRSG